MQLKKLRELAGLRQIELARAAGIDRSRLSFAESGYVQLDADEEAAARKIVIKAMRSRQAEIGKFLSTACT
jgi:transcriptional regulator with XRE-family HTH domain